jgi:hypothetical protein
MKQSLSNKTISDTVLFADDHGVIDRIVDNIQLSWKILNTTYRKYNFKISAARESEHIRGTILNYKKNEKHNRI